MSFLERRNARKEMLKIEMMKLDDIQPYENHAKIHTSEQLEQNKESIKEKEKGRDQEVIVEIEMKKIQNMKITRCNRKDIILQKDIWLILLWG
jgi:hypothetical protein